MYTTPANSGDLLLHKKQLCPLFAKADIVQVPLLILMCFVKIKEYLFIIQGQYVGSWVIGGSHGGLVRGHPHSMGGPPRPEPPPQNVAEYKMPQVCGEPSTPKCIIEKRYDF